MLDTVISWDLLDTLSENRQQLYTAWQQTKTPQTAQDALALAETITRYEAAKQEEENTLELLLQTP
jgi:hypothetical protein